MFTFGIAIILVTAWAALAAGALTAAHSAPIRAPIRIPTSASNRIRAAN
jgi:hypothetical protein